MSKLRYIEISRRNMMSKILVGSGGSSCNYSAIPCGDYSINIRRAGKDKCKTKVQVDECGTCKPVPLCDQNVAIVKASEIDDNGYAVFVWPTALLNLKEGWYEGVITNGCFTCGIVPLRIGPRCNVLKVETDILGPDSACWIDCDDACPTDICPTTTSTKLTTVYVPDTIG